MEDKLIIEPVVKRKLCTGCGTCAGICPQGAIEMVVHRRKGCYLPRLDKKRCTRCGLCHEACPGHGVDFESLSDALFGDVPEDLSLGRHLGCYVGHATDSSVRRDCASGGLVSALLIFALEEGLIDGAVVTRMREDNPLRPEPFIARTRAEVLSAAGSKHCPVAAGTALDEILLAEGRFAVVGLPCHIQGIRKAEQHVRGLAERIRYRISIPCDVNYRSLRRCTLCSDMLGELSDLTCGVAASPKASQADKPNDSFVVTRTPEAEELLEAAASNEAVELSELGLQELLASQGDILFKKRKLQARIQMLKWMGQSVPAYRQRLPAPVRGDRVDALKSYVARR